jgi:hypothetical protein
MSRRKLCAGVWAAASGPDANGQYLGAPPLGNQKFADSPVEGDGFEPSVPRYIGNGFVGSSELGPIYRRTAHPEQLPR